MRHFDLLPAVAAAAAIATSSSAAATTAPPHLVWVVADDLGVTDVPWTGTGSEILTPALSRLAASGLVLDGYYNQPLCTPTRAAFMTGRHPVQLGLQHGVIADSVPDAVPPNETMLPQLLREHAGYSTAFIGKWHLGFHQPRFTPVRRGFDSALGYYTGNAEYWNHTSPCWSCGNYTAVDLHRANASHWEPLLGYSGAYSTELFGAAAVEAVSRHAAIHGASAASLPLFLYVAFEAVHGASSCYRLGRSPDCSRPDDDELQVPPRYEAAQSHVSRPNRRKFAGMVGALDEAVGNLSAALESSGLAPRTLLLFTSDNGAPFKHLGGRTMSNWPLRGGKGELWEGGVRGACFIAGGALPRAARGRRSSALAHASDWLPTLLSRASVPLPAGLAAAIYGVDVWSALMMQPVPRRGANASVDASAPQVHSYSTSSSTWFRHSTDSTSRYLARHELLHNIDPVKGSAALRLGDLKLVRGEPPSGWGPDPRDDDAVTTHVSGPSAEHDGWGIKGRGRPDELFDIVADPEERHDLAGDPAFADDLLRLQKRLEALTGLAVPVRALAPDPAARPTPIPGLQVCTPSPAGPILCDQPVGVWRPWEADGYVAPLPPAPPPSRQPVAASPAYASVASTAGAQGLLLGLLVVASLIVLLGATAATIRRWRYRKVDTSEKGLVVTAEGTSPAAGSPRLLAKSTTHEHSALRRLSAAVACAVATAAAAAALLWSRGGPSQLPANNNDRRTFMPGASTAAEDGRRNNILLLLTDDQDQMLGGGFGVGDEAISAPTPMPQTRRLLGGAGLTARNFFAHTPICCPSRAQLLTGRYLHNLRVDPSQPPLDKREDCMHVDGRRVNNRSFAVLLQRAGFQTALFGKYLNRWPMHYAPEGFDAFLGNGGGSYIGPKFVASGMQWATSEDLPGGIPDGMWHTDPASYTTAVVGNYSVRWMRRAAADARKRPWFAMVAPKAAHEPFVPAPWHVDTWDPSWPRLEPRPAGSWNASAADRADHHSSISNQPSLSSAAGAVVSGVYRSRWQTLLAVDDLVAAAIGACAEAGVLDTTYVLFTSDHGFTLGELAIPMDKRQVYDFNTRVPLLVRGPGIVPGSVLEQPATHVDLAPTLLAMAGIDAPGSAADTAEPASHRPVATMDGRSLLPLLVRSPTDRRIGGMARRWLQAAGPAEEYAARWRSFVLIEHNYWTPNTKCVSNCTFDDVTLAELGPAGQYPHADLWCTDLISRTGCWATEGATGEWARPRCTDDCYPTEDRSNNFAALRHLSNSPLGRDGSLYAEFETSACDTSDSMAHRLERHGLPPCAASASDEGRPSVVSDFARVDYRELYAAADTWQVDNLLRDGATATAAHRAAAEALHEQLHRWIHCVGAQCP